MNANDPSPEIISHATAELRTEAGTWTKQAAQMRSISSTVSGLSITDVNGGMFATWLRTYNEIVDQIKARTGEGAAAFDGISSTLKTVADIYDAEEAAKVHALMKLY